MIHIFSFLDTCTLLLSLDISSLFYSRITHDHVWKDRWIWRSNHHNISLTYTLYREIRNLEIELILDCCEFMKDSSRDQSYYDHKYEKMNIWILECLLSFCDHLECFHENHEHEDSLIESFDFLSHLGVQFSLLENKKFYQFIQHYHTIIKFYVSQQRWESFFHRIQDPFLPSFYRNLSCILMEGLIQIAALQPFGCKYSRVQKFAHLIVERTWKKVGEHSGTLELLHTPSYFPSLGWSLTYNSRSISDLEFSSFLRKREIVANHDRLMVNNSCFVL